MAELQDFLGLINLQGKKSPKVSISWSPPMLAASTAMLLDHHSSVADITLSVFVDFRAVTPSVVTCPFPRDSSASPPAALMTTSHVYVRPPLVAPALSPAYHGPCVVHKRSS
jgi:hypothetical protein